MAFVCPQTSTQYSDSELMAPYTGSATNKTRISPSGLPTENNRTQDESKLLNSTFLQNHIRSLKSSGIIPAPPDFEHETGRSQSDIIAEYVSKVTAMKDGIKDEYCHYMSRYRYAISTLFDQIANATTGTTANLGSIESLTEKSMYLNRRLQDISQISNAISEDQYVQARQFQHMINDANADIQKYMDTLKSHAAILQKEAPVVEIKKRMVEYTKEKAGAHKNLLSLYFFLDVVALGLLFYVYKASA
jgi:hypothetical protein